MNVKSVLILIALLAVAGFLGMRAVRSQSGHVGAEANAVVFTCQRCQAETVLFDAGPARPVCSKCGSPLGTIKHEKRARPAAPVATPPAMTPAPAQP